jgi:hypothetical protein
MSKLSLKFKCAFENIEEMKVDGEINNEKMQASTKREYGNC